MKSGISVRLTRGCGTLLVAVALMAATSVGTLAETSSPPPDQQHYATLGADPYMDSDLHVALAGGQATAWSYVHLDLRSLPPGASITSLQAVLFPNASASQNVHGGAARLQACVLDQPMPGTWNPASPPAYNCDRIHTVALSRPDGSWTFDLSLVAADWKSRGINAFAIVGQPTQSDIPSTPVYPNPLLPQVTTDAWTVGLDHTRTKATISWEPPPAEGTPGTPPLFVPGPVALIAAPEVSQAPPAGLPTAAPAVTPQAPAVGAGVPRVVVSSTPRLSQPWLYVLVAVVAAGLTLLAVGTVQHAASAGAISLPSIGGALLAARSRMATPIAVLALAAIVSAGYAGQLVTSVRTVGGGSVGGPEAAAGGPTDATTPGATSPSGSAGGGSGSGGGGGGLIGGTSGSAGGGVAGVVPGVTPTTVTIGMERLVDSNQTGNQAVGASTPTGGDSQQQAQIMVDWVNAHGGVAGRKLVIRYQDVSNARAVSDPNYLETVCQTFTEDFHVFAVVDYVNSLNAKACYAQHHTLLVDGSPEQAGQQLYRDLYPYLWSPSSMGSDRAMKTKLQGLNQLGYFQGGASPTYKIGVLLPDVPLERAIFNQVTSPGLHAYGVSNITPFFFAETGSVQGFLAAEQAAVAKAEANGINHIITEGVFSGGEGGLALGFMISAYKQGYHPRYGFGTTDDPAGLAGAVGGSYAVPKDQLPNAVAVGWNGGSDVQDQYGDPWPAPASTLAGQCIKIMRDGGMPASTYPTRADAFVAFGLCEMLWFLQDATAGYTNLNVATFADHAIRLGSRLRLAGEYAAFLGPNHLDGPNGYRQIYAVTACADGNPCFKYKSFDIFPAPAIGPNEL